MARSAQHKGQPGTNAPPAQPEPALPAPAEPEGISVCKHYYDVEWCEGMHLVPTRLEPLTNSDGEPCAGGLPEIPYDGGLPEDAIRRIYQRGTYRTQLVIKEPGRRPRFARGAKIYIAVVPEGEPLIPRTAPLRGSAAPTAVPRREPEPVRVSAPVQPPEPAPTPRKVDRLRRLVRAEREEKRALVLRLERLERERDEEKRQREREADRQREREERARDRAEMASLFQQGAAAITTTIDEKLEETKGVLLDEVEERIAKLGAGTSTDRYAMAFQAGERIFGRFAEAKAEAQKDERASIEQKLRAEFEAQRAQLLSQLGQEQAERQRLAEELKKRGHVA